MSSELEVLITELEAKKTDEKATRLEALRQSFAELEARILKLEQDQAERENKKNHKFQLDVFFQKYQIALEVQGDQQSALVS
ncbi:hypothetical protein RhiirA5_444867 [Rhizophagus irregularis]|uniref:Uncharacterized protein n=1 Tax=Rhizophagus irregularis TaxID=588596 RepID=A0A2N0NCT8_9GLOM|nr:hypothetical protein RhiirA5_444867 [Rhizophagus irregularis]